MGGWAGVRCGGAVSGQDGQPSVGSGVPRPLARARTTPGRSEAYGSAGQRRVWRAR